MSFCFGAWRDWRDKGWWDEAYYRLHEQRCTGSGFRPFWYLWPEARNVYTNRLYYYPGFLRQSGEQVNSARPVRSHNYSLWSQFVLFFHCLRPDNDSKTYQRQVETLQHLATIQDAFPERLVQFPIYASTYLFDQEMRYTFIHRPKEWSTEDSARWKRMLGIFPTNSASWQRICRLLITLCHQSTSSQSQSVRCMSGLWHSAPIYKQVTRVSGSGLMEVKFELLQQQR